MKKRLLSALLALCMVLTMVPAAFAAEDETADTPVESGQVDTVPDDTSSDTTSITTQAALEAAIESAPVGDTITLDGDIEVASTIRITGKSLKLDMNGKQIYNDTAVWNEENNSWSLISVGSGADLTIEGNGSFQAKADDCYAIDIVDGGRCIIENGVFDGNISAVYVLEGDLVVNGGTFSIQQIDQNKQYAFLLNCRDENYKNGKARITVNGGTFENFNPRACAAESTGNTTNFCASGCIVEETTQDNNKNYTVKKLNNGQMAVIPEQSEPGSVSASLEGTYTNSTSSVNGSGEGKPSGSVQDNTVSVNLTSDSSESATSASLNMPADTAKSMADNGAALEVKSNVGTLTVSNDALKTISGNAKNEAVTLSIARGVTAEDDGTATYELKAQTNDGTDVFTKSTGIIEVSVPVPTGVTMENVRVYYLGPNGAEKVNATVKESNVIWTVNHFSTYLVTATEQDISVTDEEGNTKTYTDLKTAINNAEKGSTITLLDDVELTQSTDVTKSIILDLNGYTVTGLDNAYSLRIHGSGVSVTIKDSSGTGKGKITSGRDDNGGIVQVADAAKLTLESGTIEATGASGGCPVLVMGKGAGIGIDNKGATFNMTGGTLKANGYFALAGNGTWDGTTITISGGTITSANSAGIYNPQEGTLTLNGGTISGTTAVQICAGTLNIPSNSTVTITATGEDKREGKTGDGLIDDGSAVSVVSRAGYGDAPTVTIAGGTFVSENETPVLSYAWKNDDVDKDGTRVEDFVSGGSFSDSVSEYVNDTLHAELVKSSGYAPYSYYQDVATALNAAQPGDAINDLAVSGEENTCTVTLDYNDNSSEDTVLTVAKDTSITLPSPNRFGYTFRHWSDGSETYSAGMKVTINDDITFTAVWRSNSSSSSSSGGSSSSSNRYTVSVDSGIDNGSISVSPSRAERGDTVTITIDPDEGYELDSLTVRDSSGDRISVERQSDTRYTFEMPSGRVTVDATFTEVAETPETPDQIGSFTDVDTDDWFADAVQYMLDNGMMNGVTDTTFGPGTTTTRGMIVTILYRLEGEPDTTASSFTDAASGMYYADAVAWAQANSIVTGITETIFAPDQAITREQMAAILYRYAQYKGYDVTASNDLSSYTDASRISAYATTAMQWANAEGLITGNTSTTINPTGNATRAEVATILMRFCETVTK